MSEYFLLSAQLYGYTVLGKQPGFVPVKTKPRESTPNIFARSFFLFFPLADAEGAVFSTPTIVNYLLRLYYVRGNLNYGPPWNAKKSACKEESSGRRARGQRRRAAWLFISRAKISRPSESTVARFHAASPSRLHDIDDDHEKRSRLREQEEQHGEILMTAIVASLHR